MFIQYNETDFDFLTRNLHYFGIFFLFHKDLMLIIDDINQIPERTNKPHVTAYSIKATTKLTSKTIKIRDYNHKTPEIAIEANSKCSTGYGYKYFYGEDTKNQSECERLVSIRHESIEWQHYSIELETDCPWLLPGASIQVANLPTKNHNKLYRIIGLKCHGDQNNGYIYGNKKYKSNYTNKLLIIPANIPFRPTYKKQIKNGVQSAFIKTAKDNSVDLNEQGSYKINFIFSKHNNISTPLRLMQPYSGENYGFHFPLNNNTEVLYTFIHGNPFNPVILGSLPNKEKPSPINNKNKTINMLGAEQGGNLIFNDAKTREKIVFATKNIDSSLSLDAKKNQNSVSLSTKTGELDIECKKTFSQRSLNANMFIYCKEYHLSSSCFMLKTYQKDFSMNTKKSIKIKNNANCNITTKSGNTIFKAKNHGIFYSQNDGHFYSKKGDIYISAQNNLYLRNGKKLTISSSKGDLVITNNAAKISIAKNGVIHIKAKQIYFNMKKIVTNSVSCNLN